MLVYLGLTLHTVRQFIAATYIAPYMSRMTVAQKMINGVHNGECAVEFNN